MMSQANHVPLSPLSFLARARRAFAGKLAVVDADGTEVSYGELGRDCDAMAAALRADGIRPGDLDLQAGEPGEIRDGPRPAAARARPGVPARRYWLASAQLLQPGLPAAGFEAEALAVQELWLAGRRGEATEAVPDDMAPLSAFVSTNDIVRDRLRAFRAAGITMVRAEPDGATDEKLQTLRRFKTLVRELGPG